MIKGGNIVRIGVVRPKVTNFQDWKGKLRKIGMEGLEVVLKQAHLKR